MRCLVMDMVQNANSGHPGSAISMAPVLYTLYARAAGLALEFALFRRGNCYLRKKPKQSGPGSPLSGPGSPV